MAWFLFIDESGQDHKESPYEVLAGVAIEDRVLWPLIKELHDTEVAHFGRRYSAGARELKGKKILKAKTFRLATLNCQVLPHEVPILAKECLDNGGKNASVHHLKALSLAKIGYVTDVFTICERHGCKIFVSMVDQDAPKTTQDGLRKDYGYLFERFFYFLEDQLGQQQGIVVFDELEKSQSHILIDQAHRYFRETAIGRHRASLIVPEPFFVHSDLTTGVQIADLVAYCMSWCFRFAGMHAPRRDELLPYTAQLARMRFRAIRNRQGNPHFEIWSVAHITDLRTQIERLEEEE
ncbi:MAG TPA: DUF3800 domain-containing protein [Rhizomicrobium sp.]|jgi:hypothetical protein|nr:DUF3800 domain-containing protein [Rhizomicrobium sp.]